MYIGFWWGNLRKRDNLEDPDIEGDNIKMDLHEVECGVSTGSSWHRTGAGDLHL